MSLREDGKRLYVSDILLFSLSDFQITFPFSFKVE